MADKALEFLTVGDTFFDISGFSVQLPAPLDPGCRLDMNGFRFYGGQAYTQASGIYTFGSQSTPTYVLIGFVNPTFTPMLLAYGLVTLNSNNGGIDFYNYVSWTQGLYTVANQLAVGSETPATVFGGMTIQPLAGGFYTDSLRNPGQSFPIDSFASGTVTTTTPNSLTPGQNLQFINLGSPAGGVQNGTGYRIAVTLSTTKFTIEALDGHDVSAASANGGSVTSIPSPSDSESWGALIPTGQQMQLTTPDQLSSQSVI